MSKQIFRDIASTVEQLKLLLVEDERDRYLNISERAAIVDCRAVLQTILLRRGMGRVAKVS